MSSLSTNAQPLMSLHYSVVRTTMDNTSSSDASSINVTQSTSAISSNGWHSARANAMNSSVMRGPAWRDVASFSSPRASPSPKNSALGGERGPAGVAATFESVRGAAPAGASLGPDRVPPTGTSAAAVSPTQHAALAKSVNGFREFVAHLPPVAPSTTSEAVSTTTTTTAKAVDASAEGLGSEASHPHSLEATKRPRTSLQASPIGDERSGSPNSTVVPASQNLGLRGSASNPQPPPQQPLPPSTVPSHRIPTVTPADRSPSPSPSTQLIHDVPHATLNRRVCATTPASDPSKANEARNELVQIQSNESGFVIMATRRRSGKESEAAEEDDAQPPTVLYPQASATSGPGGCPSDPLHESAWMASRISEFMASNSLSSHGGGGSGGRHQAKVAFQQYLEETRATVLNADATEEVRASALDAFMTRSKELFDLLDNMHASLVDGPDRRRYTMLTSSNSNVDLPTKSAPRSEQSSSPSDGGNGATPTAGATAAATAAVSAAGTSANSDEVMSSNGVEPLTFTSRVIGGANQLPNLGPTAALRLLGGFERGRRNSFNSCSTTNQAYIDIVNHYCILRLIGIGATGRAYLALDRKTNNYYAMKTVAKRTRRSTTRQFPLRPPSSLSEECSVLEGARPMPSLPDSVSKLPPRYMNNNNNNSSGGAAEVSAAAAAAAGAVTPPSAAADGTLPSSITRTACYPSAASSKQGNPSEHNGLREADMEEFAQTASHSSALVIPYVESVVTGASSSVSVADNTSRDNAVQAVLVSTEQSRPATSQSAASQPKPLSSFGRRPPTITVTNTATDAVRTSSNEVSTNTSGSYNGSGPRPPIPLQTIRAAAPGVTIKDASATPVEVELSAVEREIRIMRRVQNHTHVVQLREVIDDEDDDCAHLIMTYAANGPLTMVHGYDPVHGSAACNVVRPFSRCARLLRQLAEALIYVHRQRIVHNDVKPDNILLTESDNILLTDFGESVLIPKNTKFTVASAAHQQPQHSPRVDNLNATVSVPHNRWKPSRGLGDSWMAGGDFNEQSVSYRLHAGGGALNAVSQMLMTEVSFRPDSSMFLAAGVDGDGRLNGDRIVVGSPAFAAPELIDSSTCSYKSDTWSFGVVLYAIVFGRLPFAGPSISETFDEILHAPLTFPTFDQVPQSAELSEAGYDQWVSLCTRLLVREPQDRLSLHAMLRHPFFRSTMPPPTSPKSSNGDALSSSCRSTGSRQATPDTASNRRCTPQSRQSPPSGEHEDADLTPISRTIRSRPSGGDVVSPPLSVYNESLSRVASPATPLPRTLANAGEGGSTPRTPRALSVTIDGASPQAAAMTGAAPSTPPPERVSPPTVAAQAGMAASPRRSPPTLVCVPAPPSVRLESIVSSPSKPRLELPAPLPSSPPLRRPSEGSVANFTPSSQSSITQLPSVTMPSRGTDTLPPSCSSAVEDPSSTLPTPPRHLREKTLTYYQSSELASSARTASPKEGSLFSVSHRYYVEPRRESAEMTPRLGTPLLSHTAASTQSFEKGEMRRLVLNSRESTVAPTSVRAPSYTGSEEVGNLALMQKSTATSALAASQPAQDPAPAAAHRGGDRAEEEDDHVACDVSVGGATRRPQDAMGSSANLDDALSRQDAVTDYYSYWNESDGEADESSSAGENQTNLPQGAPGRRGGPHTPHDAHLTRTPVRRSLVSAKPRLVPVLSNREEVLPGHVRRGKDSVVRTKREKSKPSEERRGSKQLPPPPPQLRGQRSTSRTSEGAKDGQRRVSGGKRGSSKSIPRTSLPSGDRRRSTSLSRSEVQEEEKPKEKSAGKQPQAPESKSWFKRRH